MADESGSNAGSELTLQPTSVVTKPRRRALWGVLAAVAVAAGALAVTSGGGDGALPTLPVALGASDRDSAAGAAAPTTADMQIGWITYVAGADLPALGGEGPVYRLAGGVDEATVRALATALGLAGDPIHEDGFWHLQTADAVIEVYEQGGGSWWYSEAAVGYAGIGSVSGGGSAGCEGGPAVDCVAPDEPITTVPASDASAKDPAACTTTTAIAECGPDTGCVDPIEPCPPDAACVPPQPTEPQPPADLPSKDEARQIALDLLTAAGTSVDGAKVTVDGPYEAWYVTVEPVLDGLPLSGLGSTVAVGSKGAITSASGTLGTPELLGDYPLIDTRAAVDRLNEQQVAYGRDVLFGAPATGSGSASGEATTEGSVATACDPEAPCDQPVPAPTTIVCPTGPDGSVSCDPAPTTIVDCLAPPEAGVDTATTFPCGPYPEPEPVEVVLTEVERILVLLPAFDDSGDLYLLSGYRFSGDDGTIAEIAAVADESLAPSTTVPESTVETPAPPPPTSCETPVEDDGSGTTHTVNPCPPEIQPSDADLTHLSEGEQPVVGVSYYVDLEVMTGHCSWVSVQVGDRWWWAGLSAEELSGWSTPTEGGSFTLLDEDHAEFVGDEARTKVADLTPYGDGTTPPACL